MSFREKMLWTSLLPPLPIWLWYWGAVLHGTTTGTLNEEASLTRLLIAIGLSFTIQMIVGGVLLARNSTAAMLYADEREAQIEYRGFSNAYLIVSLGVLLTVICAWMGLSRLAIVNEIVLMFLLAEVAKTVTEIRGLRITTSS